MKRRTKTLKPRIAAHQIKPEQVHKSKKNYDRRKAKKVILEILKVNSDKNETG